MRPHVLLSVAVSVDGYIDDRGSARFPLSNAADFDRVDALRAESDAILVGAETIRRDNPRLLVADTDRRAARVAAGRPAQPIGVTVTARGDLRPERAFWHQGVPRVVYTTTATADTARTAVGAFADVVALGERVCFGALLDDLGGRGVQRLMVEGGGHVHTAFLADGLADEIRVAVAPVLVGQADAPRFLHPATFPGGPSRRFHLAGATALGDVAVLRYLPKADSPEPDGTRG